MEQRTVTLIHGDKGGVGKSLLATTLADFLITKNIGNRLIIVDADQRNPDVSRLFPECSKRISLTMHEGWGELYDLIELEKDADILVNLPAGIGKEMVKELPTFKMMLDENDIKLVVYFPLDRLPDTVNLLKDAVSDLLPLTKSNFVVVKNLYFSPRDEFEEFDESDVAGILEAAKAKVIKMPELERPISKMLAGSYHSKNKRDALRVSQYLDTKPPASLRLDLQKWVGTMHGLFTPIHQQSAPAKSDKK